MIHDLVRTPTPSFLTQSTQPSHSQLQNCTVFNISKKLYEYDNHFESNNHSVILMATGNIPGEDNHTNYD
jgi:hypothetical protein